MAGWVLSLQWNSSWLPKSRWSSVTVPNTIEWFTTQTTTVRIAAATTHTVLLHHKIRKICVQAITDMNYTCKNTHFCVKYVVHCLLHLSKLSRKKPQSSVDPSQVGFSRISHHGESEWLIPQLCHLCCQLKCLNRTEESWFHLITLLISLGSMSMWFAVAADCHASSGCELFIHVNVC